LVVEDQGVVTSGGVSLAIDGTLYLIGRIYGVPARDEVAKVIEYDRAFAANAHALGIQSDSVAASVDGSSIS
jgi:transcriptional regulator GlxA family with amidase domain